ncbi:MAG: hypothetical protein KAZ85_00595 [Gammaproteobacteria bacterium]|nr:hypothetical protein [Gammaproteobacteria bacterium]
MSDEKPVLSLASRKVIRRPPPAMSSANMDHHQYPVLDESVDFMEIRRATIALAENGLWATPELVRMYVGKMMDLPTVADVLKELE